MAIYWCDPYLNSPIDGIHGTATSGTSSGDGSYAAPWSLTELSALSSDSNYNSMSHGDELRFKGLSEDTFFPPSNVQPFKQSDRTTDYVAGTAYNGYENNVIYLAAAHENSLVKIKQQDRGAVAGEVFYYKNKGNDAIRTINYSANWEPNLPPLDIAYGYIPIDSNYTNSIDTAGYFLYKLTKRVIITAGWTSETVQDGITVIDSSWAQSFSNSVRWGPDQQYESSYILPIWDCGDTLIFSRAPSSGQWSLYGAYIKLKALADAGQNYNTWYLISGTQYGVNVASINNNYNMGEISVQKMVECNIRVISYGKDSSKHLSGATLEFPFICQYGNTHQMFASYVQDSVLKLKQMYGYGCNNFAINNGNLIFNLLDGWNFEMNPDGSTPINFDNTSTELRIYLGNNSIIGTQGSSYKTLSGWTQTKSMPFNLYPISPHQYGIKGNNTSEFVISGDGLFDKQSYSQVYYQMGFTESLRTNGVNLEDITISPLNFTSSVSYPWTQRINIRNEGSRMLPVTLLQPNGSGYAAMLYNSPNFSYKKAIRFFPECLDKIYCDVVSYEIPSFAAESVTYTAVYTTTSNPGITIYDELYLYDTSLHRFVQIASITGSADGTTITCTYTLTSGELANKGGQLVVVHRFDKTSADVAEVAYTNITIV